MDIIGRKEEHMATSMDTVHESAAQTSQNEGGHLVCPFDEIVETLGKPHTLRILYGLYVRSPMRFGEIQEQIQVQPKTLTSRLQELVRLGLVERVAFNEIPPRVDYSLTQKGRDLGRMFKGLNEWAGKYDSRKS
jgi:DNA-binding HxlR family transcriptional regulator